MPSATYTFSNGTGCYSELSGQELYATYGLRFTIWAGLTYAVLPDNGFPGYDHCDVDKKRTKKAEKKARKRRSGKSPIYATLRSDEPKGTVEVAIT